MAECLLTQTSLNNVLDIGIYVQNNAVSCLICYNNPNIKIDSLYTLTSDHELPTLFFPLCNVFVPFTKFKHFSIKVIGI